MVVARWLTSAVERGPVINNGTRRMHSRMIVGCGGRRSQLRWLPIGQKAGDGHSLCLCKLEPAGYAAKAARALVQRRRLVQLPVANGERSKVLVLQPWLSKVMIE